jgi:hypothetical protein
MKLSARAWLDILQHDYPLSKECVIFTTPCRARISIRKDVARMYFADFDGIKFQEGDEITLLSGGDGGMRLALPDWAVQQLELETGDFLCITKGESGYKLKKLVLTKCETDIPGFMVIDTIRERVVDRVYTNHPAVDEITHADIQKWLSMMGQFKHDPLAPFWHCGRCHY